MTRTPWMDRVTDIIHSPPGKVSPPGLSAVLETLSRGYAAAAVLRSTAFEGALRRRRRRLPIPVVSVGNLTVGGTGKTPIVAYLAEVLAAAGRRPAIVSRGYRGGLERHGGVVSDGRRVLREASDAGDEPFMLALQLPGVPVAVGRDRFSTGCRVIAAASPDVVLLDDGFQHLQLARDVDILLLDAQYPFGNGHVLPRGPLREPVTACRRASAVVFTRADQGVAHGRLSSGAAVGGKPAFRAVHRTILLCVSGDVTPPFAKAPLAPVPGDTLRGRRVVAFSGIADNGRFLGSLTRLGASVVSFAGFRDHHHYRRDDVSRLLRQTDANRADAMVTTEKDCYRLLSRFPEFCRRLTVVGVRIDFPEDAEAFRKWLLDRLPETAPATGRPPRCG